MRWQDEGIIVSRRAFSESALILEVFTAGNGRQRGLVRPGRKSASTYEIGNWVQVQWSARLAEHLGTFKIESLQHMTVHFFSDYSRLCAVQSACALMSAAFPEGESHPQVYQDFRHLLHRLAGADWQADYIRWELSLLREMGYGIDFSGCPVTGEKNALSHVSPRTGRAVSQAAAGPYADRLLTLPLFLRESSPAREEDIHAGLHLTGYFLERHAFLSHNKRIPAARKRLVDTLMRQRVSAPYEHHHTA